MDCIDTHAHLDDEQFRIDLEPVLTRAVAAGVRQTIVVGIDARSSSRCVQLASEHAMLFAAVGIQPNSLADDRSDDWEQIVSLAQHDAVVAIGETGLDHYWDFAPLDRQEAFFRRHLQLSQQIDKPFVVHLREPSDVGTEQPCAVQILKCLEEAAEEGPLRGVMHSYTGSAELVPRFLELGLYISLAGMVTFSDANLLREMATVIPVDRILVETDSPYLSPEPVRKMRRNEPANVVHTLSCLAAARGIEAAKLAEQTTLNARRLFRLPKF